MFGQTVSRLPCFRVRGLCLGVQGVGCRVQDFESVPTLNSKLKTVRGRAPMPSPASAEVGAGATV